MNSNATFVQRIKTSLPMSVFTSFSKKICYLEDLTVSPVLAVKPVLPVAVLKLQGILLVSPGNINTQIPACSWTQVTVSD